MKMAAAAMSIIDWEKIEPTRHPGEVGFAQWRTCMFGDIRVRIVEYSPGYLADHWCSKGHVILCMDGPLEIELADGTHRRLESGQTYHVGDGEPAHRSHAPEGAYLFIVD